MRRKKTRAMVLIGGLLLLLNGCSAILAMNGQRAEVEILTAELDTTYGLVSLECRAHNTGTAPISTLLVRYRAHIWDDSISAFKTVDFWNTFTDIDPGTWQIGLAGTSYWSKIVVEEPIGSYSWVEVLGLEYQI